MFPNFPNGLAIPCYVLLGAIFIMFVYHFLLYLQYRERVILKYCSYLLAIGLYLLADIYARIGSAVPGIQRDLLVHAFNFIAILTYAGFIIETLPFSRDRYRKLFTIWKLISGSTIVYVLFCFGLYVWGMHSFEKTVEIFNTVFKVIFVLVGLVAVAAFFSSMNNRFLKWIKWGAISYLFFMSIVLYVMLMEKDRLLFGLSPMHYVYIGTLSDVIIFSVAMSFKTRELVLRVTEIRNKLSRDLHDDIGATLSSIHLYSSVAAKALDHDIDKVKDALKHINENARGVMDTMSDIVWAMKTTEYGEKPMEGRFKNYGYELLTPLGINCTYRIDAEAEKKISNMEARKYILLIVKEAINNMAKYSNAVNAEVSLTLNGSFVLLHIKDDGKGFNAASAKYGNGLQNMKQRAEQLGGSVYIHSSEGEGTSISCKFPITTISDS